jgi:hypothetical protein
MLDSAILKYHSKISKQRDEEHRMTTVRKGCSTSGSDVQERVHFLKIFLFPEPLILPQHFIPDFQFLVSQMRLFGRRECACLVPQRISKLMMRKQAEQVESSLCWKSRTGRKKGGAGAEQPEGLDSESWCTVVAT